MLTETGKEYLRYVTEAFDILLLGQQNSRHAAAAPRLMLYTLPSLATKWLLPELHNWRACTPDVDLALHGTHAQFDFNTMHADFVICFGEERYAQLEKKFLFHDEVLPVPSPELIARYQGRKLLGKAPLIHLEWVNERRFLPNWRDWFQAKEIEEPEPQPSFIFNLTLLALHAAVAGAGVILGQRNLIANELASGTLVIVDELSLPHSKPNFLAWPQRTLSQPGSRQPIAWPVELAGTDS